MVRASDNSNSHTKLMRITDDGKEDVVLNNNMCASTVTIDHIKRKLYWIEECNLLLEESELDGSSPQTMVGFSPSDENSEIGFSSGLGQYEDKCYYTQRGKVVRNGLNSNMTVLYTEPLKTFGGLVVVHPSKQPPGKEKSKNLSCSAYNSYTVYIHISTLQDL